MMAILNKENLMKSKQIIHASDLIREKKEFENQINSLIKEFESKHPYLTIIEGKEYKIKAEADMAMMMGLK